VIGAFENADQLSDMPRKGREGLLNRLLVADIRKNVPENAQTGTGLGRDLQPSLRHQHHKTDRFQRYSLAAGVGTGEHDRKGLPIQLKVDRYDLLRV